MRQDGLTSSTALHTLHDLQQDCGELDYVFLSPIYNSISKKGYSAAFRIEDLPPALARARYPVIALGGVTAARVRELRDLGFAGAAVIGSVWEAADPLAAFQELQKTSIVKCRSFS
ncbi:hypothetical protein WJX81_006709 [Elliptochloris bilobata]|uniref:Thiamine phosphate synthase/TenI domain-containing protein n=1 Tax=Elliptochloris bilobata TaxID=381761 RepID=A0AAW1RSM0_9CHLO